MFCLRSSLGGSVGFFVWLSSENVCARYCVVMTRAFREADCSLGLLSIFFKPSFDCEERLVSRRLLAMEENNNEMCELVTKCVAREVCRKTSGKLMRY